MYRTSYTNRHIRSRYHDNTWQKDNCHPCPKHLLMCRWWRDRATAGDFVLHVLPSVDLHGEFDDGDKDDGEQGGLLTTGGLDLADLALLGEHGLHETRELIGEMQDAGLIRVRRMDLERTNRLALQHPKVVDVGVVDWWIRRHLAGKLNMVPLYYVLMHASAAGRTDTLDLVWKTLRQHSTMRFESSDQVYVNCTTWRAVTDHWVAACKRSRKIELPLFSWKPSGDDTLAELQAFWDCRSQFPVEFSSSIASADKRVLEWALELEKKTTRGSSFKLAWNARRLDTLEFIVETASKYHYQVRQWTVYHDEVQCDCRGQHCNSALMVWWCELVIKRDEYIDFCPLRNMQQSLRCGHMDHASWWVHFSRKLENPVTIDHVLSFTCFDLCKANLEYAIDALKWIGDHSGAFQIPADIMARLLDGVGHYSRACGRAPVGIT
ncbi:hypothetical protein BC828DRAFT_423805 [Blastocladiella britannica]|nr:hypothetical protein BC828DRAFT_423805 [Blastocladiella britannica]